MLQVLLGILLEIFMKFMFSSMIFLYCRHVNLPVLPNGLHIMADQGFVRTGNVLVLPRNHRNIFPRALRRYTSHGILTRYYFSNPKIQEIFMCLLFQSHIQVIQETQISY